MLYLTCTTITSVDLAHYGVSRAKDGVSVDCGTIFTWSLKVGLFSKQLAFQWTQTGIPLLADLFLYRYEAAVKSWYKASSSEIQLHLQVHR